MKKKFVILLLGMLLSQNVFSQTTQNKFGLGYQGVFLGNISQGISGRYWASEKLGWEGNFFTIKISDDYADAGFYMISGKLLYASVKKENSRFYFGGEIGIGRASSDDSNESLDLLLFSPIMGSEYHLQGLPEIGFNWDIGYRIHMFSIEDYDFDIKGTTVSLGVHYYF
ncbi:hypothetical protein L6Q79_16000 [bacterium]|nr:hypothetical protein [bacterium]